MKTFKILLAAILAALTVGCAPTQSVVMLKPYAAVATNVVSSKEVYIAKIVDVRKNQSTIATITDKKGDVSEYVVLQNNLAEWFKTALEAELRVRGANVGGMGGVAAEIYIQEFGANLSGYDKDNMKGNLKIALKIQKGDETINKSISNSQTKFELIRTGSSFNPFLDEMIEDAVKRTAAQILGS